MRECEKSKNMDVRNTTHHFFVNGTENVRSFTIAGTNTGCMDQTGEGTVPNQYGTWWYGRSGWCPGKEVQMVMIDITDQVTGGENTIEYQGLYRGEDYTGSASIVMSSLSRCLGIASLPAACHPEATFKTMPRDLIPRVRRFLGFIWITAFGMTIGESRTRKA